MHTPVLSYSPGIGEAEVEQLKVQGKPGISTNSLPHKRKGKKRGMVEHTLEVEAGGSDVILGFIVSFKASLLWREILSLNICICLFTYSLTQNSWHQHLKFS